jgi:hypothetical protein
MAHLWTLTTESEWAIRPLAHDVHALTPDGSVLLLPTPFARPAPTAPSAWALIVGSAPHVTLNGDPLAVGIAILTDRDEIRVAAEAPLFFSTESLPEVNAFPSEGPRGVCPRCKQVIPVGSDAVRCPSCGIWHHQSDELPCWRYAGRCAVCEQETAEDTGFRWTPQELM